MLPCREESFDAPLFPRHGTTATCREETSSLRGNALPPTPPRRVPPSVQGSNLARSPKEWSPYEDFNSVQRFTKPPLLQLSYRGIFCYSPAMAWQERYAKELYNAIQGKAEPEALKVIAEKLKELETEINSNHHWANWDFGS